MQGYDHMQSLNMLTCELEDWFHILGTNGPPPREQWSGLTLRAEASVRRMLDLFAEKGVRATFFCLGWMAERMPALVRDCHRAGHEIGSHGYAHVLAYDVGPQAFREDLEHAKKILEDIIGERVHGFRCPGFSVTDANRWVFDVVAETGHTYDASVFPAHHGHGGLEGTPAGPHVVTTASGPLVEFPVSTVPFLRSRVCLFGGGYLRLFPLPVIRWGIRRLREDGLPLIIYIHPREIDPEHPRLPLKLRRRFKCYVNLRTTMRKLTWLCEHCVFTTMGEVAARIQSMAQDHVVAVPVSVGAEETAIFDLARAEESPVR
ncbi:MAG TPA: DUF3473 domain-containing protein [Sedimentisphaerales bacterium]|nr:DUF3473 domain-containing protein [Sedimentisphaerales bacterium]HRS10258.1 DUF3473 domain-containing protein [Sedimentisphaerales bacterium]HRV46964.1 DUF3473 domain-containing protein [Sedimentisphaerales bacterium]